ncbi:hypothetical protein [Natronomonas salsuginis]|uniref:Uncharacterized protein n=1 Tax=Natronomonas salsuginis TaxID=2217661 RepID=A0A4U5JET3_9EURY|nr:hypothetical protein [Natronomonas salsuginis]TKR27970.1 hypothetical protein DM868_02500 [Natronomonas salsuginis]
MTDYEPADSDQDPHAGQVVFEVVTLTHGSFRAGYSPESALALARDLDRATTIVACREGHDIIPITGGIPKREMPRCGRCNRKAVGVVKVEVVAVPNSDDDESVE